MSHRVVTPEGVRAAAVLVEGERIQAVVPPESVPKEAELLDFSDGAILPGLVDSHVHINEPGRTEWEGFATATRAAAAGGYTFLVDMPLNCLPSYDFGSRSRSQAQRGERPVPRGLGGLGRSSWR